MSLELELKFRVPARSLSKIAKLRIAGTRGDAHSETQLLSTYFDTKKHKLRRRGLTFRIRQANGNYIQTVKAAGTGSFARGEWESEVGTLVPDLDKADDTPLQNLVTKKLRRSLKPVFRTSVRRITRLFHAGNSEIELAVDRGSVFVNRRSAPISEFELELKSGRSADLFHLAKVLAQKTDGQLDLRSKSERGYLLTNGAREAATRAEPIHLDSKLSSLEAFEVIAFSALRHFSTNVDAVRALDAEAIHQMRVGLRRLRAAISLFNKILPNASTARIKTELKWLTDELAPAREIDVFLEEWLFPFVAKSKPKRGARAIESQFTAKRNAAFEDARRATEAPRFRHLLIDILEWIETRRNVCEDNTEALIGRTAAAILDRRIKKARKQAGHLEELSPEERHKLRIKIKKVRYGVEFFQSLYADKDRKKLARLVTRLKKIQNVLGTLNDAKAHEEMAKEAALTAPLQNRRARAFASGMLVGQEREAAKGMIRTACRELRKLHPLTVEPR
ncbi:MAG: CHAD domain-containing protein [Bradyrhizobium sp.]|nr:CHAD domain-containing protein [Bradyrhizobium sp.]